MIFVYLAFSSFYLISFLPRNKIPQNALNVTAFFFFFFFVFCYRDWNKIYTRSYWLALQFVHELKKTQPYFSHGMP